jgi:hypothetical protein
MAYDAEVRHPGPTHRVRECINRKLLARVLWFNWLEPILFARQAKLTFKGNHMKMLTKTLLTAVCAALPFLAASADAQTTRASCEADAKAQNITGADRQTFMKACLPAGAAADKPAKTNKAAKAKKKKKAKKSTAAKTAAVK